MRHNNNEGAERHWKRASKGHRNNKNVGKLVARLPHDSSKHENTILTKRHAINNTLGSIVSGGMGREKQLRWVLLPRMESKRRRAPTKNGAVDVSASLLPLVAISVAEAELGETFYNAKKGKILRLTLEEMGYKQGPTTIFVENNTARGICNSTIKRQQSRAMNGQYFWLIDKVNLNTYRVKWAPGLENMADYFTEHFAAAHHRDVRPFYAQMQNSPRVIRKVNKKISDKKSMMKKSLHN